MIYFIVNPKACSGAGKKKWEVMASLLRKKQIPYKVSFTDGPGSAVCLAKAITSRGEALTLAAVGGDGTANEVLNGIQDFANTTFGYLPAGSSNDLARAMGLPKEPEKTLDLLLHPERICLTDVGYVSSEGETRRFLVSTGIGFDAAVCHEALNSRIKNFLNRFHLGKLTYLGIALKHILFLKSSSAGLILDDGRRFSFPLIFFSAFMNMQYEGGGFKFCPDALPNDGYLDICLVERMPVRKILRVLPTAFPGKHTSTKEVHIYRCRKARIRTKHPMAVHTDGEAFGFHNDLTVGILENRLKFISSLPC